MIHEIDVAYSFIFFKAFVFALILRENEFSPVLLDLLLFVCHYDLG